MMIKSQIIKFVCEIDGITEEDRLEIIRVILNSKTPKEAAKFCFRKAQEIREEWNLRN